MSQISAGDKKTNLITQNNVFADQMLLNCFKFDGRG